MYAALKTALRSGQAPDVFYAEPDQTEYIDNQLLADLSTGINWANVEPKGHVRVITPPVLHELCARHGRVTDGEVGADRVAVVEIKR